MVKEVEITIIIPVHNSEKYLKECLESALMQTFKEFEILCIDGGSKDSSGEIVREVQKKDDRVVYMEDPDTGYGHKLNLGIEQARGKYIAILESDDKMSPKMMECLYHIANKYDVDVVDSNYFRFFNHNGREYWEIEKKYLNEDCYGYLLKEETKKNIATHGIWTALYKKEFLKRQNIRLNESAGASYQDLSFLFLTSLLAESVYHLDIPLYQYRVDNEGSSVKDDKKIYEIVAECGFLKRDLENREIHDKEIWKLYYIRKYTAFYWNYLRLSITTKEMFLERYMQELQSDIQDGSIYHEMFDEYLNEYTFLAINDRKKFIELALQRVKKSWREEFCEFLDRIDGRDIVIFGIGIIGSKMINMLQQNENRIIGLCDNSRKMHGIEKYGFTVMSVEDATKQFQDALYVIANRNHTLEMYLQLIDYGIKKENIIRF